MRSPLLPRIGEKQQGLAHVQLSMNEPTSRCQCPRIGLLDGVEHLLREGDESCRVLQDDERGSKSGPAQ